jgi:hypothetical protein
MLLPRNRPSTLYGCRGSIMPDEARLTSGVSWEESAQDNQRTIYRAGRLDSGAAMPICGA